MKQLFRISVLIALALMLAVSAALADMPESTATLCADFSCGDVDPESNGLISRFQLGYDGELTALTLAEGLTALTGLDFFIDSVYMPDNGIAVDWLATSTLVAGLDDREQNEDFFFYDVDTLSWFMMDSLARTLKENLNVEYVYYSMDGGKELALPDVMGGIELSSEYPYEGSGFYYAHYDLRGEDETEGYAARLQFVETVSFDSAEAFLSQITPDGQYINESTAYEGAIAITNRSFEPLFDLDQVGTYFLECAAAVSDPDPVTGFRVFKDAEYTEMFSYPGYLTSWKSGSDDDLRENVALFVLTDSAVLMYRVGVFADSFDAYRETIYQVLGGLTIEFL